MCIIIVNYFLIAAIIRYEDLLILPVKASLEFNIHNIHNVISGTCNSQNYLKIP